MYAADIKVVIFWTKNIGRLRVNTRALLSSEDIHVYWSVHELLVVIAYT